MSVFSLWLLAISPFVGSFLGVLADRLPQGRDVLTTASACDACGHRLGLRDLIPLGSSVWLRGRCRWCSAAIPRHLPLAEGLGIAAAALALALGSTPTETLLWAVWLWCLVALGISDWRSFTLPLPLTLCLLAVGLWRGAVYGEGDGTGFGTVLPAGTEAAVLSAAVGFGALWAVRVLYRAVRRRDGLGFGDVILMAGISAVFPVSGLPVITLVAALLALGHAAVTGRLGGQRVLPFGTFLCAAAAGCAPFLHS